jgi:hypothetical protein
MKRIFTPLFFLIITFSFGQNFHFEPTNVLTKVINSESMSDLKIDIIRDASVDTLYLKYELITNTLPTEWYQGYCDNHGCWGSLPESGTMSACFDEFNSYITLSIDPLEIEGSGTVEYYIYEVEHYEDGLLMTFNAETPNYVGINQLSQSAISFYPNPASDYLTIDSQEEIKEISLYNLTGKLIQRFENGYNKNTIDISSFNKGMYLISIIDIFDNQITKKLTIQ